MGRRAEPASVKAQKAAIRSTKAPPAALDEVLDSGARAPGWLKAEGLAIWKERAPILRAQNLLKASDELAFARYCRDFALWIKLRGELDRKGYTYDASTTTGGTLRRADPRFLIADRLERSLEGIEDRFGLNPSARQRIVMQRAAAGASQGQLSLDKPTAAVSPAGAKASPIGALNLPNRMN